MPVGDPYAIGAGSATGPVTPAQRADLQRVVQKARDISGFVFAVYLGPLAEGRATAIERHASLPDAASAVLVAVDPTARSIEIVTGTNAAIPISERSCELAVLAMTSCFANNDLVGGLREGVTLLAMHARHPRTYNLDEPA